MARGKSVLLGLVLALAVAMFLSAYDWAGAQEASMVLKEKEVFKNLERPPVGFTHEKHSEKYSECMECHHEYHYKDGKRENVWSGEGKPCGECHKLEQDGKKPPLRNAFHQNCTGCHRSMLKEGQKTGPVTCGECHVRSTGK